MKERSTSGTARKSRRLRSVVGRVWWTSNTALRDLGDGQNNWLCLYRTRREAAHYYGGRDVRSVKLVAANARSQPPSESEVG